MKGAIFDLDGTLASTIGFHDKIWVNFFKAYGITLTEKEIKEQVGARNAFFIKRVLGRRKIKNLDIQELSSKKDKVVIEALKTNPVKIFPKVEELLKLLKAKKIKLALATSASKETAFLLGKPVIKYFDVKIFAADVVKGKPHPEIFLKAAKKLGLEVDECIVFEDAKNGVDAAKAGGFFCVAKVNGLGQDLSAADLKIKTYNPQELMKLFKKSS